MVERKLELDARRKGSLGEKEDWWYLTFDTDTGRLAVEHEWSHTKLKSLSTSSDSKYYTIEEFLALTGSEMAPAQTKLRATIAGVFGGGNS